MQIAAWGHTYSYNHCTFGYKYQFWKREVSKGLLFAPAALISYLFQGGNSFPGLYIVVDIGTLNSFIVSNDPYESL